jgi:WD40 repeat protein
LAVPNNRGSRDPLLDINTYTLAVSPDGQTLAAGQEDGVIRLGRVADWQLLRILEEHSQAVTSVAFSPNSELLASKGYDHKIYVWRVSDGQLLMTRDQQGGSISFSPDEQLLVVG